MCTPYKHRRKLESGHCGYSIVSLRNIRANPECGWRRTWFESPPYDPLLLYLEHKLNLRQLYMLYGHANILISKQVIWTV